MKDWKQIDPQTVIEVKVGENDVAKFETGTVHSVYSTFALGRDAEWCTRQFALALKDDKEEGIGTYLNIKHLSPAFVGETVVFKGQLRSVDSNQIHATFVASVRGRIVATGETGQKIILKSRLNSLLKRLK